eukprot:Gb_29490 [translate_table: standard]
MAKQEDEVIASKSLDVPSSRSQRNARLAAATACVLLLLDSLLTSAIIAYVPYTKIDWDAYMSQVTGFMAGERDYSELRGDTGPLVYPAGFLYFYSAIRFLTGGAVFPAQKGMYKLSIPSLSVYVMWRVGIINERYTKKVTCVGYTSSPAELERLPVWVISSTRKRAKALFDGGLEVFEKVMHVVV